MSATVGVVPAAEARYVTLAGTPVLTLLHRPAPGTERDVAVLLCSPFGWDDDTSYRSRRMLAHRLAQSGVPALRLDLPGTGDSAGTARDEGLVPTWVAALAEAAKLLRETAGARRVVAFGIGIGGLLAVEATAQGAPIDDFVLWAVPGRGRSLVRELRTFAAMEAKADTGPDGQPEVHPDGTLHVGGFALTAETVDALGAVDLTAVTLPAVAGRRALLLDRDGIAPDKKLVAGLEATGVAVESAPGPGYGTMLEPPHIGREPLDVIARVVDWVGQDAGPGGPLAALTEPPGAARVVVEGAELIEEPFVLERPNGIRLFGVLTRPAAGSGQLGAVLLNAGAIRRTGPNRMWVELARRWAAWGVPTLRVDLEGIGDADGSAERRALDAQYGGDFERQVVAVLDELVARGVAREFVCAGLCSGAYWSIQAAGLDGRVRAALLVNPRALVWRDDLEVERETQRLKNVVLPSRWLRLLRGDIDFRRLWQALRVATGGLLRRARHLGTRPEAAAKDSVETLLDGLRERGTSVELIFAGWEPLREELERDGHMDSLVRWPNVRLSVLGGTGDTHTLRPAWLQREVRLILDGALNRELGRAALADEVAAAEASAEAAAG